MLQLKSSYGNLSCVGLKKFSLLHLMTLLSFQVAEQIFHLKTLSLLHTILPHRPDLFSSQVFFLEQIQDSTYTKKEFLLLNIGTNSTEFLSLSIHCPYFLPKYIRRYKKKVKKLLTCLQIQTIKVSSFPKDSSCTLIYFRCFNLII